MNTVRKRIAAILYIILSAGALVFWLGFIFFALFFGGSPGPYSEQRTMPLAYIGIMAIGLLGAKLGIAAGITGLGAKPAGKILPLCAAMLGIIGSLSFFLMDLTVMGVLALLPGILPSLLYLILKPKRSKD